ncbi:MAG TPA: hypothetical protein VFC54_07350 [Pseudolabrys sp.]|nr:hypothetical protein [Pseudolabrys sp.]
MQLNEEACPVPESVLGELYRVSPHGLNALIETVPVQTRARLALYCYRRAHLASIGLAIAASCDEGDLAEFGGNLGADLFVKSREADTPIESFHSQRRKISLSSGPIRQVAPFNQDDE